MNINGYIGLYDLNNRLANKAGIVYEHMIVAEKILGRPLEKEEVVHHIDGNRSNNNIDNLMIFKTKNDHTSFHHGGTLIKNNDGTYSTKKINSKICPICGGIKTHNAERCINCVEKIFKTLNTEQLNDIKKLRYDKKMSYENIGKKYNVSHTTIRRWFLKYKI